MRRPSRRRGRAVLLLLMLAGCGTRSPDASVADTARRVAGASGPLAELMVDVDTSVTLGAWIAAHPHDVVSARSPEGIAGPICRVASTTGEIGGRRVVRSALFAPPVPPRGELFPDTAGLSERMCTLRSLWIAAGDPGSMPATAFADTLAAAVDALLGPGTAGVPRDWPYAWRWTHGRRWHSSTRSAVLGILPHDSPYRYSESRTPMPADLVLLATHGAGAGLDTLATRESDDHVRDAIADAILVDAESATSSSAPEAAAALRPLLAGMRRREGNDTVRSASLDAALVAATRVIHHPASPFEPRQQAAALLALDIATERLAPVLGTEGRAADRRLLVALRKAGARYEQERPGGSLIYQQKGLRQAFALDSAGPVGRLALHALMENGWHADGYCTGDTSSFGLVIAVGERALAAGSDDPLLHYHVAVAYSDVVALAHYGYGSYVEQDDYVPRAAESSRKAIEHFRAALRGLTDVRLRRDAWRMAVALTLGQSPQAPRYFCVDD